MRVQFDHKVKYQGEYKPAHVPFEIADRDLAELKKAGAVVIGKAEYAQPPKQKEPEQTKPLDEMTVEELRKFAVLKEVDLKGLSKKAEILEAIQAVVEKTAEE